MSRAEQVKKAIGAHGIWKARLRTAIDTGKFEKKPEEVRADNNCEFGQWLYGTGLSTTEKNSEQYKDIQELHAEFHKLAARVIELATSDKKAEAEEVLTDEYKDLSSNLTRKLMAWMHD